MGHVGAAEHIATVDKSLQKSSRDGIVLSELSGGICAELIAQSVVVFVGTGKGLDCLIFLFRRMRHMVLE